MSKDVNVANKEQLKSVIEKYSFHNQSRQQSSKIETVKEKFLLKKSYDGVLLLFIHFRRGKILTLCHSKK